MSELPDPSQAILLGGRRAADDLATQAPVFAPLVDRFGPATVEPGRDRFAALVEAICSQQLSLQAAATVYGRIEKLCDGTVEPGRLARATTDELRACGLSRAKVSYVQDLASQVRGGPLDLDVLDELPDRDVVERLTAVKGIGVWTAHMVLIFTLHRPDVLPTGDLGVRDGARRVLGLDTEPTVAKLSNLAEPWRPYRSVASWYLWKERDRQLAGEGKR